MSASGVERQIIHDLLQALNAHDVFRAANVHAVSYRGIDVSRAVRCEGRSQVRQSLEEWLTAFPDLQVTARETLYEPGRAALFWIFQGTQSGAFMRIPPTRRKIIVSGFSLFKLRNEEIIYGMHLWDAAEMLRSMKLLPDLPDMRPEENQATVLSAFLAETG